MRECCDPGTRREAKGCGQTPRGAGRGTGKESAQRNSFPASTVQVQLESLLIRPVPKSQQLREQAEMARAPCQEPLISRWTLPVLQLATDKGLQGQDSCPHGPMASNPTPIGGMGGQEEIGCSVKGLPDLGTRLSFPT